MFAIAVSLTACDGLLVSGLRSDLGYYYDPDIAGIDLNNKGIRDDVDDYIANYKFEGKPIAVQQKDALKQLARAKQKEMVTLFNNKKEMKKATEETFTAMNCMKHRFFHKLDNAQAYAYMDMSKKTTARIRSAIKVLL